jgi:hypothetical protein
MHDRVSIPGRGKDRIFFYLRHRVQTGSGTHSDSCPVGTGNSRGVKRPGRETDHSSQSNIEVKNAWSCVSTPLYVFMTWYFVKNRTT